MFPLPNHQYKSEWLNSTKFCCIKQCKVSFELQLPSPIALQPDDLCTPYLVLCRLCRWDTETESDWLLRLHTSSWPVYACRHALYSCVCVCERERERERERGRARARASEREQHTCCWPVYDILRFTGYTLTSESGRQHTSSEVP